MFFLFLQRLSRHLPISKSVGACRRASLRLRMERPMESASEKLISRRDTEAANVLEGDAHDVQMHGACLSP